MNIKIPFRSDISGLRGVAVLGVLLCHAGIDLFRGGFIGVDIFFVLSGYLVTTLLTDEFKANNTISFKEFYLKRVRRLLPALLVALSFSCIFSWLYLTPDDLVRYAKSLIATLFFFSNISFWRDIGYFSPSSIYTPLLHTWSLGIEGQFYLIFPFMIYLCHKQIRVNYMNSISALLILSFILTLIFCNSHPNASFYLLPTRLWEFGLGYFAAQIEKSAVINKYIINKFSEFIKCIGLISLVLPIFLFTENTPTPSIYTAIPTTGAFILLAFIKKDDFFYRLLSNRYLQFFGFISYSLYLYHQIFFSFLRITGFNNSIYITFPLLILISYLSTKFIEIPFREKSFDNIKKLTLIIFIYLILITYSLASIISDGFKGRLSESQLHLIDLKKLENLDDIYRGGRCFLTNNELPSAFLSECDPEVKGKYQIFLWGDSFAAHLYPGLKLTDEKNIAQYTSGCPPLLNLPITNNVRCDLVNQYILSKLSNNKSDAIILSANWVKHRDFLYLLDYTIKTIKLINPKSRILLVGNFPHWYPSLPDHLIRLPYTINDEIYLFNIELKKLLIQDIFLRRIASENSIEFFSPIDIFCDNMKCMATIIQDKSLFLVSQDYGHLGSQSSEYLASYLKKALNHD